jgi:hypothetical protein
MYSNPLITSCSMNPIDDLFCVVSDFGEVAHRSAPCPPCFVGAAGGLLEHILMHKLKGDIYWFLIDFEHILKAWPSAHALHFQRS